jgi:hypothetical protein
MIALQQDEVSEDLMTFHEKVNHMQELEEEIIDDQKSLIEVSITVFMLVLYCIWYIEGGLVLKLKLVNVSVI